MPDQPQRRIYTPTQLNREVRFHLEQAFGTVGVEGEVSNLTRPRSGHLYFTLKDDQAQIRCALFKNRNPYGRVQLADGQQIVVRGRLSLYEARGEYQLLADAIEDAGEGRLQRQFEQLKRKLAAEGLFEAGRKQALPRYPRSIAVVTSPTGAAIRDVISVIERRYPAVRLLVVPAAVQGAQAPAELRAALARAIALGPDLILLTRGGGSLEDLAAFNDEALARAIADCPIPTVCAVGHEVDFSIAEFVADQRAPTPSAAAELMVPDRADILARIQRLTHSLRRCTQGEVDRLEQRLDRDRMRLERVDPRRRLREVADRLDQLRNRARRCLAEAVRLQALRWRNAHRRLRSMHPQRATEQTWRRCCELEKRLIHAWHLRSRVRREQHTILHQRLRRLTPAPAIQRHQQNTEALRRRLSRHLEAALHERQMRLKSAHRALEAVSPQGILERGYSVTTLEASGAILRDAAQAGEGERIVTRLAQGSLQSVVRRR